MAVARCASCGELPPDDARFCPRCGTVVAAAPAAAPVDVDPLLQQVIAGRYLIVEKVGQGASGVVYRAEHKTLHKRVAVKVLHLHLSSDDAAIERFRREATTVSALDNEHILQVLDFGRTDDKRLFFAMEYVEGQTLDALVTPSGEHGKGSGLDAQRVVNIVEQTAEALSESHALGYIHRDLRPRNIFLTTKRGKADFVKLLDFGLAKLVAADGGAARQTALGMTFGDPRYMAPEQIKGDQVDGRTDVYALCLIAYEALTGHAPYSAPNPVQVVELHLNAPIPSVRAVRHDCPQWLDQVIQRGLAKRPADRFATMADLLTALRTKSVGAAPAASTRAPTPSAAAALASAVVATPAPVTTPAVTALPSVIVDDWGAHDAAAPEDARLTKPTPIAPVVEASAVVEAAPVVEASVAAPRQDESSGEWFQQKGPALSTPSLDDDDDELLPKSRMPLYIGLGAGGATLAVVLTLALWPHPPQKPLRGEVASNTPAATVTAPAPAAPAAPVAAPAVPVAAPAAPVAAPTVAAKTPEPPPVAPPPDPAAAAEKPHAAVAVAAKSHPAAPPPSVKHDKRAAAADEKDFPTDPFKDSKKAPAAAATNQNNAVQAEFFVKLGRQKLGASDLSAAAANFSKARDYDPHSADAVAGLGEVAFEQGDYSAAATQLKQALRIAPDRPRYLVLLGQAYYKLGRPKDAIVEYKRALKSDPNNQEAQRSLDVAEKKLN